jgi:hypothetical protein
MSLFQLIREYRTIGNTDNPEFDKARRYYDWRNYVPDEIVKTWKDLTVESRVMVYLTAEKQAQAEEKYRKER